MSRDRPVPAAVARIIVYGGGLVFVGSLLLFLALYFFSTRFGVAADAKSESAWRPILVNVLLFSAFALHHSLFARTGLKEWIGRIVSPQLERSTYVWIASLAFVGILVAWQPVPGALWTTSGVTALALTGLQVAGIVLSLTGAGRVGGLTLAGISQATERVMSNPELSRSGLYGFVRHPIYLGWLLMVWPSPVMTGTRCVFAAISTAYLMVAIPFEERDLHRSFGTEYADYARHVRWRMVPWVY